MLPMITATNVFSNCREKISIFFQWKKLSHLELCFFVIFFFTSQAQLSADETVCMKCQELFGWEYKYSSDGYVWLCQFDLVYKGCSFSIFKVVLEQ